MPLDRPSGPRSRTWCGSGDRSPDHGVRCSRPAITPLGDRPAAPAVVRCVDGDRRSGPRCRAQGGSQARAADHGRADPGRRAVPRCHRPALLALPCPPHHAVPLPRCHRPAPPALPRPPCPAPPCPAPHSQLQTAGRTCHRTSPPGDVRHPGRILHRLPSRPPPPAPRPTITAAIGRRRRFVTRPRDRPQWPRWSGGATGTPLRPSSRPTRPTPGPESVQYTRAAFTARRNGLPLRPCFSIFDNRRATTGQVRHRTGFERQHFFFTLPMGS